jgi:hypothetical protein
MSQDSKKMVQFGVPPALGAAIKRAADNEMTTISEFARRVLIERLRATGIDPKSPARRHSGHDEAPGAPA